MDHSAQKEQFSTAYVKAVAAAAGYAVYSPSVDDDSIDMGIAGKGAAGTFRAPRLEIQLKCTAQSLYSGDIVSFPLKLKNYNDLRAPNVLVPRILLVAIVPEEYQRWVKVREVDLILTISGYWTSLISLPQTSNTSSVHIHVPVKQRFSPATVTNLMEKISLGGRP